MDPMEDPDDILRANRSREKTYMFDVAFDFSASQVRNQSLKEKSQKVNKYETNVYTCPTNTVSFLCRTRCTELQPKS